MNIYRWSIQQINTVNITPYYIYMQHEAEIHV